VPGPAAVCFRGGNPQVLASRQSRASAERASRRVGRLLDCAAAGHLQRKRSDQAGSFQSCSATGTRTCRQRAIAHERCDHPHGFRARSASAIVRCSGATSAHEWFGNCAHTPARWPRTRGPSPKQRLPLVCHALARVRDPLPLSGEMFAPVSGRVSASLRGGLPSGFIGPTSLDSARVTPAACRPRVCRGPGRVAKQLRGEDGGRPAPIRGYYWSNRDTPSSRLMSVSDVVATPVR
jgi:hypothetical protein